jgi:dTDP-4-dehydrorhamnose reductase
MNRVLVTGGKGMLGSELVHQLARAGYEAAGGGRDAIDVLDREATRASVAALTPDVVIDCALPRDGERQNDAIVAGARNVAEAGAAIGARSVYLSCAWVFDGRSGEPYVESDMPSPDSPLGEAKLAAERAVTDANPRHAIVRTAWLFGPGGANLVDAALSAGAGSDRVPVDAHVTSSPTYTGHLAQALIGIVRRPAYGIFHLAGGGSCTELQLARTALRSADSPAQVIALEETTTPATPVRCLALSTRRSEVAPLPDWRLGLRDYLEARTASPAGRERLRVVRDPNLDT